MEFENIIKLIECVSKSSLTSFTLEEGDTKIIIEANRGNLVPVAVATSVDGNVSFENKTQTIQPSTINSDSKSGSVSYKGNVVKSPLVGVFYSAASPDAPDFVKVGDRVSIGQTLGIVEAMKLMNEIECDFDGVIKEVLIKNEEVVEYGQPLFVIE